MLIENVLTSLRSKGNIMIEELSELHGHVGETFPIYSDQDLIWVKLILSC